MCLGPCSLLCAHGVSCSGLLMVGAVVDAGYCTLRLRFAHAVGDQLETPTCKAMRSGQARRFMGQFSSRLGILALCPWLWWSVQGEHANHEPSATPYAHGVITRAMAALRHEYDGGLGQFWAGRRGDERRVTTRHCCCAFLYGGSQLQGVRKGELVNSYLCSTSIMNSENMRCRLSWC